MKELQEQLDAVNLEIAELKRKSERSLKSIIALRSIIVEDYKISPYFIEGYLQGIITHF